MTFSPRAFRRLTEAALGLTLAVVVWGALVRATGSGAGCGAHWPACNGGVVPRSPSTATLIEYAHRLTSGLALLGALAVCLGARRVHPPGHRARRAGGWVLVFMLTEAAVGALLVLQQWVARDTSASRAVAVSVHLFNTFLLLGALALAVQWAEDSGEEAPAEGRWPRGAYFGLTAGWLAVGASGAIAALGDTLFPAASLREGLLADASATAHFLVRLRAVHPVLAAAIGLGAAGFAATLAARVGLSPAARRRAGWVMGLVGGQLFLGAVNLVLLAPIALQLAHLLLADLLWIAWVQLGGALRLSIGAMPKVAATLAHKAHP